MNQPVPPAVAVPIELTRVAFDDSFVRALPGDAMTTNVPRAVPKASYSRVAPTRVASPRLLGWSDEVAALLGVARPAEASDEAVEVLAGNRVLSSMQPYAARYGGHQFGHWAGQLGDGRAITLGEIVNAEGQRFDIQLKGAGLTPYSRGADGRAVLRSSVREFMCSEAMHHLGVPTTRALSLVATGDTVIRDMFYDGNPEAEPGAIVCRVAPTFVRFGNFQIHAAHKEEDALKRLADYVITTHYPHLGAPSREVYTQWFHEICRRTARMIVDWMRVGFVHGVMNTDNMSILGVTIDYGPYGWLEGFDPSWTPNTTDAQGRRYAYGNQPQIAQWNLLQLANALYPLFDEKEPLEEGLKIYADVFQAEWPAAVAQKLGLTGPAQAGDEELQADLFNLLNEVETDYTLFLRALANVPVTGNPDQLSDAALVAPLKAAFYDESTASAPLYVRTLTSWLRRYVARVQSDAAPVNTRAERMNHVNPKYVLRNYMAQLAIDGLMQDDTSVMERIMTVLKNPYDEQPGNEDLAERRPEWARNRAGCSALS